MPQDLLLLLPFIPPFNQEYMLRWLIYCGFIAAMSVGFDFTAGFINIVNFGYMAVAGFGDADLDIHTRENKLVIAGKIERGDDTEGRSFLHRGIAGRSFERQFSLADHIKVAAASLENGLLHVDLVREVPEAMKPRSIEIKSVDGKTKKLEKKAA